MKRKILNFTTIAIIMFLGACSNEDLLPESNPDNERTISLIASMPDEPTTRVSLTQDGKNIKLKWEVEDKIELVFVQEGVDPIKVLTKVDKVTNEGKKAQFLIKKPDLITGDFILYGVYGGGGLGGVGKSDTDPTHVILPLNDDNTGSLASVKEKEHVMLYFASKTIKIDNLQVSVAFQHLGSLFSITVKNTSITNLDNLSGARLIGVGGDATWAFNSGAGGGIYDLVSGEFQNTKSPADFISFKTETNSLLSQGEITLWGWYPPHPDKVWPELKLQLKYVNGSTITSINSLPKRTKATNAGQSYYFYSIWDGSQFGFTDESSSPLPPLGLNEYYVAKMGTLGKLLEGKLETIETLILKGEINKADFDVMKMQMPALRNINLENVTCEGNKIPYEAFGDDDREFNNRTITTIILPKSITRIEASAFDKCTALTGSITIPDGVTSIDKYAFAFCDNLNGTLTLSADLWYIGLGAFIANSGLNGSLIIPDKVEYIEESAFNGCSGFTGSLTLPDGLTKIGQGAFFNCYGISGKITLPINLRSIGEFGFQGCGKVDSFKFPHLVPLYYELHMLPYRVKIEVPEAAVATYKRHNKWGGDFYRHDIVGY